MGRKKKNADNDNSFPAKYVKVLGEEAMKEFDAMDADQLKAKVIESQASIEETEAERDADVKLKAAKDDVKLLASSYKETIFYQTAKIKYCMRCLDSKGAPVSPPKGE